MKLVFIVNEGAGNGKGLKKWRLLEKELQIPYEVFFTTHPGHAVEIARTTAISSAHHGEELLIVAVGGDGTVHEVIEGIMNKEHISVGVYSAGSGNDFARGYWSFRNGLEIQAFMKNLKPTSKMDLGQMTTPHNAYHFVNNAGIGFDAYIADAVNHSKMKKRLNKLGLGKMSYAFYVMKALFTFKTFSIQVEGNGLEQNFEDVWFAVVSNQAYFGGGMKISPTSKPDDGMLELTIVHNISPLKLLLLFGTVFLGTHTKLKQVYQLNASTLDIKINGQVQCHTDGEYAGMTNESDVIQFQVLHESWRLAHLASFK